MEPHPKPSFGMKVAYVPIPAKPKRPAVEAKSMQVHGWCQIPAELLTVTLDQLRTLCLLESYRSAREVATLLNRDQSSVQTQINTLNRHFEKLRGDLLVKKGKRSAKVKFTPIGKAVSKIAGKTLERWAKASDVAPKMKPQSVSISVNTLYIRALGQVWEDLRSTLGAIDIQVHRTASPNVIDDVRLKKADLALGSAIATNGKIGLPQGITARTLYETKLAIVTNIPDKELPSRVSKRSLLEHHALIPHKGALRDYIDANIPFRDFKSVSEYTEFKFAMSMLQFNIVRGWMIVPDLRPDKSNNDPHIRFLELDSSARGFEKADFVVAIFGKEKPEHHPASLVQHYIAKEAPRTIRNIPFLETSQCG